MQKVVAQTVLHGVYILTAAEGERRNGMTAAWVCQVSFRPLIVAVSVAPERYTFDLIDKSGYFALCALKAGQEKDAKHFGFVSGRKGDKFEGYKISAAANGSPVLEDSVAYLECKVVERVLAGDHTLFLGEVVDGKVLQGGEPLPFRWSDYFK
jgi:flavin reductase (DIM6/NTAB) family NADH-FMN oxidoreductase RutF